MSQEVAVHQDAGDPKNKVARDQDQMLPRDATTTEATQATKATASSNSIALPNSNDNDNDVDHLALQQVSPEEEEVGSGINHAAARSTSTLHDSLNIQRAAVNTTGEQDQGKTSFCFTISFLWVRQDTDFEEFIVIQSTTPNVLPVPLPRDTTPPTTPPSNATTLNAIDPSHSAPLSQKAPGHTRLREGSAEHVSHDGAAASSVHKANMVFGSSSSKSGASHRRRNFANTSAVTEEEADLTSKDRAKQKEAVKRFLNENVKNDWTWEWPQPVAAPVATADASTEVSSKEDNVVAWKERDEWSDNASEGASDLSPVRKAAIANVEDDKGDPYRFESPDGVGEALKNVEIDRRRRRKKRLAEEMTWNQGLRCFSQRRDAWTGARHVSHSSSTGLAPIRKQRTKTSLSSEDGISTALEQEEDYDWEADTEIPMAPSLIPPENGMRKMITPANYNTIYDKVILNQMTPLCPINLKDITRSCVKGWQRDGEWEPLRTTQSAGARKGRRMSVAGLFGLDKPEADRHKERKVDMQKDAQTRTASPTTSIRGKLGKILHLKKDTNDKE